MKTDEFDFDLPRTAIAQRPVAPRDAARLLLVDDTLDDRSVRELPALLDPGDVLVFNDTRVLPARLVGRRGQVRIEVTLHKPDSGDPATTGGGPAATPRWRAFARPARKLRLDDTIAFDEGLSARVTAKGERGEVTLAFAGSAADFARSLERAGAMPLPPYIQRPQGADTQDRLDYQTVYATRPGAVAAPTAGLHFTPELLTALDAHGLRRVTVTLHVGAGTFLPVTAEDPHAHRMHSEYGEISADAAGKINAARADGGRVIAVGTTALRLLESAADAEGRLRPFAGETDIFILPGYRFRIVDRLLTNFHLPRSTLFMLVCAFAGTARMRRAYAHALAEGYRFYSYGDCCLLTRGNTSEAR
jgi:S-adenosylmethionine:tRNA ribosyltransferase-isomerase